MVLKLYGELVFCLSSLNSLGYEDSLQEESEWVECSELGNTGYSPDSAT